MLLSLFVSLILTSRTVQVEVRTPDKKIEKHEVVLIKLEQEPKPIGNAKTNSKGIATIKADFSDNDRIAAYTEFEGLSYFSDLYPASQLPKSGLKIKVFYSKASDPAVVVSEFQMLLKRNEAMLDVEESFVIDNPTQSTIVGEKEHPEDAPEIFRFSIPKSAFNLSYGQGFRRGEVQIDGNDIVVQSPLMPGKSYYSIYYSIDRPHHSASLERKFSLPIDRIELALNDSRMKINSPAVASNGLRLFDNQNLYLFTSPGVRDGMFTVEVSGLPWNIPLSWWLPFALFICALILLQFGGGLKEVSTESKADETERKKLLLELKKLERLDESKMISKSEYFERKLKILQKISHFYTPSKGSQAC